jgi:hypothetical protein
MSGSPRSDSRGLPTCRGDSIWMHSIYAKRTQFGGAGAEATDKIFVRRLGIVGGLDWGRVLAARETSAAVAARPAQNRAADGIGRGC